MLKSKLHRARVTESNLEYEGSCAIDQDLMDLAGIVPYEMVMICNLNNGERFDTYVIPGKRGSGEVSLNGAAARKGIAGDKIIIFSFRYVHDEELKEYNPKIVVLTDENRPK
ncbi:MAG TPA: aspartate 1-decarboxylase [Nitrospirae bacterium]|nr:aspartate 1-decarboxylase [Nitrospirota bacterium]HDO23065.1 aspartate 1-decarboxylase [Nitrospirota bacterium]